MTSAQLRDGCSTQATKAKPKPAPKKKKPAKTSVLKAFTAPATTVKGCVVNEDGSLTDVATRRLRGRVSIGGKRPVKRIYKSFERAKKLGAVIDIKEFRLNTKKPTLDDMAAYLRPGQILQPAHYIFQGSRIKSLAGEDGVEYWGWNVQNKHPGAENKWVFVAVQEKEE